MTCPVNEQKLFSPSKQGELSHAVHLYWRVFVTARGGTRQPRYVMPPIQDTQNKVTAPHSKDLGSILQIFEHLFSTVSVGVF
jgi:hypothetical protein